LHLSFVVTNENEKRKDHCQYTNASENEYNDNQFTHHKRSHPPELIPKEDSNNKYGTHHCKPRTVKDRHDYRLYDIQGTLPRRVRVQML
jgi:hypothetical protein